MERDLRLGERFYQILILVVSFHFLFLISNIKFNSISKSIVEQKAISLKIVQEDSTLLKNKKQIVQSEDTETLTDFKKNSFLSDKNRSFERESVSKKVDNFKVASKGNSLINQSGQRKDQKKNSKKKINFSDLGVGPEKYSEDMYKDVTPELIAGDKSGEEKNFSRSSTNDFVEEVKLGDFTRLNTTEYKHYGFFHRIRQKLEQFWGKSIREKAANLYRAGRRVPASENLITSLQVTLNEKGEIVNVKILSTSGFRELDEAAVNSFNQAGPFPNPPKDLLVNGRAVIEWGFVVKS